MSVRDCCQYVVREFVTLVEKGTPSYVHLLDLSSDLRGPDGSRGPSRCYFCTRALRT